MVQREQELRQFALDSLAAGGCEHRWQAITGDASSRRYFRLEVGADRWICADSPPATEKNSAFVAIQGLLEAAGLPVPALRAVDAHRGFFVQQDLGDRHLLQALQAHAPGADYSGALPVLLKLQAVDVVEAGLPEYDQVLLKEEFDRFYSWFCMAWLDLPPQAADQALVDGFGERLLDNALQQPRVFVFRDFQSRNLLVQPDGSLGLIDFQDAVCGPLCYDLASLLRDCYIRWPESKVRQWALYYRQCLLSAGRPAGGSDEEFLRWFDWIGLHRHLKVLGNFTRLSLRDGKHGYLADIPMVLDYIREVLARYPEAAAFRDWFQQVLEPRIATQRWEPRG